MNDNTQPIKYTQQKRWRDANLEKAKELERIDRLKHKEKRSQYQKEWRSKNKEKSRAAARERYAKNKEKKDKNRISELDKVQYCKNKQKRLKQSKEWHAKNKERVRINNIKRYHRKIQSDPLYVLKCRLRACVYASFKRIKQNKPTKTQHLIGCDWEEAKLHFERLFKEGMSWDNYGEWEIDHIRPVSDFKQNELDQMNHISNLQPLWRKENRDKWDSVPTSQSVSVRS